LSWFEPNETSNFWNQSDSYASNIEKPEEAGMRRITLHAAIALITFLVGISIAGAWRPFDPKPTSRTIPLRAELKPVSADEEEIHELYRQYAVAQTKHDVSFFERAEADSFVLTYTNGESLTRAQAIAYMKTWDKSIKYSNAVLDIQLYGDVAIVKGEMTATYPGSVDGSQWRYLDMLMRRDGDWQILSTTQINY
jgi:ketosteroid isomerase-like protein